MQVPLDVDAKRFEWRQVHDSRATLRARFLALRATLGGQLVDRPEEGAQRLARARRRHDQGVVPIGDLAPALIAFGATLISAVVGTTLGFLAAHSRGFVEQVVLMLADFQASMPFLILALAVLAFFGNSLPLLIGLMGLYGWERYARIARGLAALLDVGLQDLVRELA